MVFIILLVVVVFVLVVVSRNDWRRRREQEHAEEQKRETAERQQLETALSVPAIVPVAYRGLAFVSLKAGPLWGDLRSICVQVRNTHYTRAENISALLEFVSAGGRVQECEAWWISHPDSSMDTIRQRTSIEPGETALLLLMYQDHDRVLHWSQVRGKDILEPGGWTVSLIVSSDTVEGFAGQISFAYMLGLLKFVHPAFKFAGPVPIGTRSLEPSQPPQEDEKA